ncbi:MAG TPA: prolipoprotein diacylglyceryl transferase family protein, partial [Polyangiaceae bacterium]
MRPLVVEMLAKYLGAELAQLVVPGYAFMLALGAIVGAMLAVAAAHRDGVPRAAGVSVLMAAYVSGLAGACAVPAAQAVISWSEGGRLAPPTGFAAYGGLAFGTLGGLAWIRLRHREIDPWRFLDAVAPSLAIGIFFARVGCFLAGCDYGTPTTSFVGTAFPRGSHAFRDHVARGWIDASASASLPVHPTELYEAGVGLALFFAVRAMKPHKDGARFVALVIAYALARSAIELLRGDASRGHVGAL